MMMKNTESLQIRIVNCLQTILELEQELKNLELGHVLIREFDVLKSFLQKIESVQIEEDDVLRIEKATENFLDELKVPLSLLHEKRVQNRLVQ
jgi:thiamine kinase-like enzyme